jgi:hypothetical protein
MNIKKLAKNTMRLQDNLVKAITDTYDDTYSNEQAMVDMSVWINMLVTQMNLVNPDFNEVERLEFLGCICDTIKTKYFSVRSDKNRASIIKMSRAL